MLPGDGFQAQRVVSSKCWRVILHGHGGAPKEMPSLAKLAKLGWIPVASNDPILAHRKTPEFYHLPCQPRRVYSCSCQWVRLPRDDLLGLLGPKEHSKVRGNPKLSVSYPFFLSSPGTNFDPTDFCHLRRRSNLLICLFAIFGLNDYVVLFCFKAWSKKKIFAHLGYLGDRRTV